MKTNLKLITALISLLINSVLFSQVSQQWAARYNGSSNSNDVINALAIDGLGNSFVTGYSSINGQQDIVTIKYSPAGTVLFSTNFNGVANATDVGFAIAVDIGGNVIIAGYEGTATVADFLVIKYNSAGVQQWKVTLSGTGNLADVATDVTVDGAGNIYATGFSNTTSQSSNYLTVKINSAGILQWQSMYNGSASADDRARAIAIDNNGNVFVTGNSYGSGTGNDMVTIKYNSSGAQQNVYIFNSLYDDRGNDIIVNASGDAFVGGYSTLASGDMYMLCYKYGTNSWNYANNPTNDTDYVSAMEFDNSGNIILTGSVKNSTQGFNAITLKLASTNGAGIWATQFNGSSNASDFSKAVACDLNGNIYIAADVTQGGSRDYAAIKYNSSGVLQWSQFYNNAGIDYPSAIKVDISGNVYIAGTSEGNGTGFDYATIKYSPSVGIQPISNEIPDRFSLSQNYPNPFNPSTQINFSIPKEGFVKITVFDALGREVEKLADKHMNAGNYKIDFDASKLTSGIYFYKIQTGGFTDTKKMILIK